MEAFPLRRLLHHAVTAWVCVLAIMLSPLVLGAAEVDDADDPYAQASEHYAAGRWQQTADACQLYLDRHPDDALADAWRMQGSALTSLGRYAEALLPLDHYLSLHPPVAGARAAQAQRAICLARLQKFTEARQALAALEALQPDDALLRPTRLVLAETAATAGEHAWAQELYAPLATEQQPAEVRSQALLGLAQSKLQTGPQDEAAALFRQLDEQFPQLPQRDRVLYHLAWLERSLGHEEAARQQFAALHAEYPQSRFWPDAVYRLAEAAIADQDYPQAELLTTELLRAEPTAEVVPHALYIRAQAAIAQGQWDKVPPVLARLLKDAPEHALALPARYWLAEAHYRLKDYPLAATRFAELAELPGASDQPWAGYVPLRQGQIALQLKQWRDAETFADRVLADYPKFAERHEADYTRARSLSAQGRFDEARTAYERVIASPTGAKTETAAMAQWMIGESYFHQKHYPLALREYLKLEVLHDFPTWKAAALLQAGKCHEQLGERAQAIELYTRLLKQYPDAPFAAEASERLKLVEHTNSSKR